MAYSEGSTFDRLAVPYDRGMRPLERLWLQDLRSRLAPRAHGRILEVGIGTGANLPFYTASGCLTAIDESAQMLTSAVSRAGAVGRCVHLSQADAQRLPFPQGAFDTVVASLVLCSVVDQHEALSELRRVLCRRDGSLLLLEHMRPQSFPLAWLADMLNYPWHAWNKRCHLNRRTVQAVSEAGFRVQRIETKLGGLLRLVFAKIEP